MTRYWHPGHGYHVVSFGDDLAALEREGWKPEPPPAAPEPSPAPPPPAPEPGAVPPRREPWRPKRGR